MLTTENGSHFGIETQGIGTTEEITIVNEKEARGIETTEECPIIKENKTQGVSDKRGMGEMPKRAAGGVVCQAK